MIWIFFAVLVLKPFNSLCQDCQWSGIVNVDGKNSPGSNGNFTVTSTQALSDGVLIIWSLDSTDIVQHSYDGTKFSSLIGSRYDASITIDPDNVNVVTSTVTINNLQLAENGLLVAVRRTPCSVATANGGSISLAIENCNNTSYQPSAENTSSTACGFGCTKQFNCVASACLSGSFQGVCQTDATFSPALADCTTTTCPPPNLMQFAAGALNAACGNRLEVLCEGGFDFCGSTNGTCATTGVIALENTTFDCSETCSVTSLQDVARTFSLNNPRCGENATFQCFENSTCEDVPSNFTRQCGRNGVWREAHPCCNGDGGLSGGAMAGIVIGVLVASWPSFYL